MVAYAGVGPCVGYYIGTDVGPYAATDAVPESVACHLSLAVLSLTV